MDAPRSTPVWTRWWTTRRTRRLLWRQRTSVGLALAVGMLLLGGLAVAPCLAQTDVPAPPEVGAVVLEESLLHEGFFRPFDCPTGRGGFHYVGEGLRLRLSGRCYDAYGFAATGPLIRGLSFADGEVQIEVKAVSAVERARFVIQARRQPGQGAERDAYAAGLDPAAGHAFLARSRGVETEWLAERGDLAPQIAADDWNTLGFRMRDTELWLLVNGQAVLHAADATLGGGEVFFYLLRTGGGDLGTEDDPADETEVVGVARNLRVSAIADGDPAREPMFQRP